MRACVRACLLTLGRGVEIEAARRAGVRAALVVRAGNAAVSEEERERLDAVEGFGRVEEGGRGSAGEGDGSGSEQKSRDGIRYVDAWLRETSNA